MDSTAVAAALGSPAFVAAFMQFLKMLYPIPGRLIPVTVWGLSAIFALGADVVLAVPITASLIIATLVSSFAATGIYETGKSVIDGSPTAARPTPPAGPQS